MKQVEELVLRYGFRSITAFGGGIFGWLFTFNNAALTQLVVIVSGLLIGWFVGQLIGSQPSAE